MEVRGETARLTDCYLTAGVNTLHGLASQSVPEPDVSVSSAASTGQQSVVVRRPGYGLARRED